MPEHVDIVDGKRHEPKGASTAIDKQILQANGDGTTTWVSPSAVVASSGNGFADYNDAATAVTPISLVADTWTTVTNDGLGAFTNLNYLPEGVTSLYNTTTNSFDFSELTLGDSVLLRNDFTINPNANNGILDIRYSLGDGASAYTLENVLGRLDEGSGNDHRFGLTPDFIYLGDTNTKDNPITFEVKLSVSGDLTNAGTVISTLRR